MKARYLSLVLAVTVPLLAAPATVPALDGFKDSTLPLPSLSLPESMAELPPKSLFSSEYHRKENEISRRFSALKQDGRMPILTPNPNVNYKLIVKAGDPGIDPKLLFPTERK